MLKNLKLLRAEYGISQQKLANAIEISQQSINQYENHNIEPDIAVLTRLADYFDSSIDFIVGRTDRRSRIEPTEACRLNADEIRLVAQYRRVSENEKQCVHTLLDTFGQRRP